MVWDGGTQHDFDYLANEILPYTREEVSDFRANFKIYEAFDANRQAAHAAGIRKHKALAHQSLIADEAARSLWVQRYEFGKAVLTDRGGVLEGSRNNMFWPMANALAWSCAGDNLQQELSALHHTLFSGDGWSRGEAMVSAGMVLRKIKTGTPYKMRTATFLKALEVTSAELNAHSNLLGSSTHNIYKHDWKVGAMGFARMRDLSSDDFIAETKRRQGLAGARSAETRKTTHDPELREKARMMANSGMSQECIAAELEVAQASISRWLKK